MTSLLPKSFEWVACLKKIRGQPDPPSEREFLRKRRRFQSGGNRQGRQSSHALPLHRLQPRGRHEEQLERLHIRLGDQRRRLQFHHVSRTGSRIQSRPRFPRFRAGFEDPRLVKIGDEWLLTYTGVYPRTLRTLQCHDSGTRRAFQRPGSLGISRRNSPLARDRGHSGENSTENTGRTTTTGVSASPGRKISAPGIFSTSPALTQRRGKFDECLCES